MLRSLAGLVLCAGLYLSAAYAFVWAGRQRIKWGARHGVAFGPEPEFPSVSEIRKRHRADTTVIYGLSFLALDLAGFSIWQRVGFAALAALVYASFWIANSPGIRLEMTSPARQSASAAGYWCIAVVSWFGYMGILCFATALAVELF